MLREFHGRFNRRVSKALSDRGRRMANARWAKWRANAANRPEPEPKMDRWCRFEFGVRDKLDGKAHWTDLRSVRHAAKALSLVLKFY